MGCERSTKGICERTSLREVIEADFTCIQDQNIGKTLTETMSALRPATALYDPGFLLRVWLANILG